MIDDVILKDMPMPPPSNNLYFNRITGGRGRSAKYEGYIQQMRSWALMNQHTLGLARDMTASMKPGELLRVDQTFSFHHDQIYSKSGKPKKNDTFNRIKALHDCLSQLLGIDDSYFWEGYTAKRVSATEEIPPYCHVRLRTIVFE